APRRSVGADAAERPGGMPGSAYRAGLSRLRGARPAGARAGGGRHRADASPVPPEPDRELDDRRVRSEGLLGSADRSRAGERFLPSRRAAALPPPHPLAPSPRTPPHTLA